MGVHPGPCSEPGQDGPRYRQTAFNLRALRGGSDASHAADWILQRTAKVFCITVQNTVQDRTQHNGRDRSWLRDQGLGMTREQCHREALCRLHNMYFVELTWCCCCVSNADAVENNGAVALSSRLRMHASGEKRPCQTHAKPCRAEPSESQQNRRSRLNKLEMEPRGKTSCLVSSAPWPSWVSHVDRRTRQPRPAHGDMDNCWVH